MLFLSDQDIVITAVKHSSTAGATPEWAHVSGWAQLSGAPRRVSCVLLCRNGAPLTPIYLGQLSDALTEAGFPWEITCVDSASGEATARVLSSWSELPGFRWIRLAKNYGEAAATRTGMFYARGDAVILVKVASKIALDALPDMMDRWNEGHEVVLVRLDDAGISHLMSWPLARPEATAHDALEEASAVHGCGLILMDRQVVDLLLR